MHKMPPSIKFWKAYNIDFPEISQSKLKRDWMDKTYNNIVYRCPPLLHATIHGWEIRLPQDVRVIWDGVWEGEEGEESHHVKILEGENYSGMRLSTNESGVGQLSFFLNLYVQTDPDHYLLFSGPPNYIFEDAYPLSFVWRSDFFNYQQLFCSWKILTPNKEILFPKGMPIAFFTIYPKNLLESTEIEVYNKNSLDIEKNSIKYQEKRADVLSKDAYDFPQFYKHGIGPNDEKFIDRPWKIILKNTVIKD